MKKLFLLFLVYLLFASCTFDYGQSDSTDDDQPDLIMENVEYVRVRSADTLARVQADRMERYEEKRIVKLENITFEQYGESGAEVNVLGNLGYATVETDTGDIFMERGVRIDSKTEDLTLETDRLEWKDEERNLLSGDGDQIYVYKPDGTKFTGTGLRANTRMRTWDFLGRVSGIYIYEENE